MNPSTVPALQGLAAAHAPPPVGWWPPAPGWWLLAALLIAIAAALAVWWRSPRRRLQRAAAGELSRLQKAALADAEFARALEGLMRRYALARWGHEAVARLSGTAWLEFAITRGASGWQGESGAALLRAAYGGGVSSAHRSDWLLGARALLRSRAK